MHAPDLLCCELSSVRMCSHVSAVDMCVRLHLRPGSLPKMLPSVRPAQLHVAGSAPAHKPFSSGAKHRSPLLTPSVATAAPSRHAQCSSPAGAAETSGRPQLQHSYPKQDGSPAAASRRGVLVGAAAAAAASLAGERRAQAVQGLTAGRLPGMVDFSVGGFVNACDIAIQFQFGTAAGAARQWTCIVFHVSELMSVLLPMQA